MKYPYLILLLSLTACSSPLKRVEHTQPVSLSYAKGGIVDAKDFLSKAKSSNDEMGAIIKRLLEEHK